MKGFHGPLLSVVVFAGLIVSACGGGGDQSVEDSDLDFSLVSGALALSNHYVEVRFSTTVSESAEDPVRYQIFDPDENQLRVYAARLVDDNSAIILTTTSQRDIDYSIRIVDTGATTAAADSIPAIIFKGSSDEEPYLITALSLDNTSVLLTFSGRMDRGTTETTVFYQIHNPGLKIFDAQLQEGAASVLLTTSHQNDVEYTIHVANLLSEGVENQRLLVDPTLSSASFLGKPPVDLLPPRLISAVSTSDRSVVVTFDEPLDNRAANPINFAITTDELIKAPVVDAGEDITTTVGNTIDLTGSVTEDGFPLPDSRLNAGWIVASGPGAVTLGDATQLNTSVTFTVPGYYVMRLMVLGKDYAVSDETIVAVAPRDDGSFDVRLEETQSGEVANNDSLVTEKPIKAVAGDLYLAAVSASLQGNTGVESIVSEVSGLGLQWRQLATQCSGVYANQIELWFARGEPASDEVVTANLMANVSSAVIAVSRYSGVDHGLPIGANLTANVNGLNGACSGGRRDRDHAIPVTPTASSSVMYNAILKRHQPTYHSARNEFEETLERARLSGASSIGLILQERAIDTVDQLSVEGRFSTATDWASIAVELRAANRPPEVLAGPDQLIRLGSTASLAGSIDFADGASSTLSNYEWRMVSGPGTVQYRDKFAQKTLASFTDNGIYVLQLVSTDAYHTTTAECIVTVVDVAVEITAAKMSPQRSQITLETLPQRAGMPYTVAVIHEDRDRNGQIDDLDVDVRDRAGNLIDSYWNSARFLGTGAANLDQAPRVVSAGSISNNQVLVTFSEPMMGGLNSAENPAHFNITGSTSAGGWPLFSNLSVQGAELLLPERTTVRLSTLSQSDIEYTLRVTNTKDLTGTPIAPPEGDLDPSVAVFVGTPPSAGDLVDSDGDGLNDAFEQRGWLVSIVTLSGEIIQYYVTSDPTLIDTDGDGISDDDERHHQTDPRNPDTDGDQLTDAQELFEIYSSPVEVDSDGDSLSDGLEFNLFGISPILVDTDGDQLTDDEEVIFANRDPRIADLPLPRIDIGNIALQLDVRFNYISETGASSQTTEQVDTTLTQSENRTFSTSDENSNKATVGVSTELAASVKVGGDGIGGEVSSKVGTSFGLERGSTSTFSRQTSEAAEEAYHDSLTTSATFDVRESVTREVVDASLKTDVTLQNIGDIAFSIGNLELTVLAQDPANRRQFVPVAALVPENPDLGLINLGILGGVDERGPIVFEADRVFPLQVENLLRNPRGLIVELANFDILDERGRNFAFSSQDVLDRTAGIAIDYGNGEVENYRVATTSTYDSNGNARGIAMAQALQKILGLGYQDAIRDGGNALVETMAAGDDVQQVPFGSISEVGELVIGAGPNGLIDSIPDGDDRIGGSGYETTTVERMIHGAEQMVEILTSVRGTATGFSDVDPGDGIDEREAFWAVFASGEIAPGANFNDIQLHAGDHFSFAYVQDKDQDEVFAREEYLFGSSDLLADTDSDTLSDKQEINEGWIVSPRGALARRVYPNPARQDSDRDQLLDQEEFDCRLDPRQRDTDFDGLTDYEEIFGPLSYIDDGTGVEIFLTRYIGISSDPDKVPHDPIPGCDLTLIDGFVTDPLNDDTDGDGLSDSAELELGANPNNRVDGGFFYDDDGDGLSNKLEEDGYLIVVNKGTLRVYSEIDNTDTDGDGLSDMLEYYIRSNPRSSDSDGDGKLDFHEYKGGGDACVTEIARQPCILFKDKLTDNYLAYLNDCNDADVCAPPDLSTSDQIGTNPSDRDSDQDRLNDTQELAGWTVISTNATWHVDSDPIRPNSDTDLWNDYTEYLRRTDPRDADTDSDGTNDNVEPSRSRNPLVPDQRVTIKPLTYLVGPNDCDGFEWFADLGPGDYYFYIRLREPGKNASSFVRSHTMANAVPTRCTKGVDSVPSPGVTRSVCEIGGNNTLSLNHAKHTRSFVMDTIDDQFTISGKIQEIDYRWVDCGFTGTCAHQTWDLDNTFGPGSLSSNTSYQFKHGPGCMADDVITLDIKID